MSNLQVLAIIGAFLLLTVGSFIWYVATWDDRATTQAPDLQDPYHLAKNTPAGGQILSQEFAARPQIAVIS